jgi:hypothetical protein
VPDAVAEQLTSSAASSPHGCPGPSTPAVNTRATRARSARPSSRSPAPPWSSTHPPSPSRPASRETTQGAGGHTGMHARLGAARQAGKHAASAARPWPSVEKPTVRTDRPDGMDAVRYASVDTATQRCAARQGETWRHTEKTARLAENSQLAGRLRRWWQVLGSNQRRLSRRFYRPLSLGTSQSAADQLICAGQMGFSISYAYMTSAFGELARPRTGSCEATDGARGIGYADRPHPNAGDWTHPPARKRPGCAADHTRS